MENTVFSLADYAASAPSDMQSTIVARMEGALRTQMYVVPDGGIPPLPVERTLGLNAPRTLMVYGTLEDMNSPLVASACYRATGQSHQWADETYYDRFQFLVVPHAWMEAARQQAAVPLHSRDPQSVIEMGRVDVLVEYALNLPKEAREALLEEAVAHPLFKGRLEALRFEMAVKTGTDIPGALEALGSNIETQSSGPAQDVALIQLLSAHPDNPFVVKHVEQFLKDHEACLPPHMHYLPYDVFRIAGERNPSLIERVVNPHQEQHANHMYRCHELLVECEWLSDAQVDLLLESMVNAEPVKAEALDYDVDPGPTPLATADGRTSSMTMG